MFGSENVKTVGLTIQADPLADGEFFYLLKAPRALTVLGVYVASRNANNAGTAIQARLENWGTAGTSTAGTVCANLGGTAVGARLAAGTPTAAALDSTQQYVAQGDWLVVRYGEQGAGWQSTDRLAVSVQYVDGVGA